MGSVSPLRIWTDLRRADLRVLKAASVLVPLAFFAFGAWQSYRQHLREAAQSVERTVDILDQQAQRVFEVQDAIMQQIDERVAGMTWDEIGASETLHQWLKALDDRIAQIDVVWLIDPQGHGRNSSRFFPAPATSRVADRNYF